MFMVNYTASRWEDGWKSKQNKNSNSTSWGEKKISYMIDINNKWKKSEYEKKKNVQGKKKQMSCDQKKKKRVRTNSINRWW